MQQPTRTRSALSLEAELTESRRIRTFRGIDIYLVTSGNAPNVMEEIGALREYEFRCEGGGTGKSLDIDRYDTDPDCAQLVAWDPDEREIIAVYRALFGNLIDDDAERRLPTGRLFDFSARFADAYLPNTIELGRSVVNRRAKKRIHGLHAVWSALGAMAAELPNMRFFFGKVTTYDRLSPEARDALFYLMDLHFGDTEQLIRPKPELEFAHRSPSKEFRRSLGGTSFREDFAALRDLFASLGEAIPPLFISYSNLSSTMRVFGTAFNPHFGEVLETAILIRIEDIRKKYREQFVDGYESTNPDLFSRYR